MTYADLSPLANHLWQSTVFAAAVWVLALIMRRNRAAVRYWLWLAASVKFLLPFSLLVSTGTELAQRTVPAIEPPQWSFAVEQISRPFSASIAVPQIVAPAAANPILAILLGIWFCGIAAGVVFWVRCWRQMRTAWRTATPLAFDLPIPVLSCSTRVEPGVFGIRKPVLLLPDGITDRLTPAQFSAIVTHEMCHVRRRDNLTAAIHMAVEVLFWFYPLVWWIRGRLIEERERACDQEVLQSGGDASVYAEGILNVCKLYVESPLVCLSGVTGSDLKKRIENILENPMVRNLNLGRKLLLVAACMFSVTVPVVIGLMSTRVVRSQTVATPRAEFEVASIKPNKSGDGFDVRSIGKEPGKVVLQNVCLRDCIEASFGVNSDQISGPGWLDTDKFNILAQAAAGTPKDRLRTMLQTLLEDRFKLKVHREKRAGSVYALVVGKNGPKLKPGSGGANRLMFGPPGHLAAQNVTMPMLAEALAGKMGRPVLDSTSLSGFFDFTLDFAPDDRPNDNAPSLPTAVQEQLGLRLEPGKGTVEVLVIDHADRVPIEN